MTRMFAVLVVVILVAALSPAQAIHLQAGYFVPDRAFKDVAGSGPIGSVSVLFQTKYTSSILAEVTASYWETTQKNRIKVRLPEASWCIYAPLASGEDYFFGPGAGVALTNFRASAMVPNLGSGADRIFLSAGAKASLLAIYDDISLNATYHFRSTSGLVDSFHFGGFEIAAGYVFRF